MKVLTVTVSFLIIASTLGSKTEPSFEGPYHPTECCFTYITRRVPRTLVSGYYETNSQCTKPGVVFITKKGYALCANPSDDWVQDYIKGLEEN
ncbi:C-C motif chemokine 14-like [Loxodonta africana]|uniref:C-C motif chemokine ligand 14 n=1 Tax=Loxodonta africana TaxID=9785 RepID=G3TM71_LOXAF|nr:C-C motif chemokine 14-like [Loxodonta africana]XP_049716730.1 C-C motif chemokine 14 isoform X2 [Elephas maximus indicus]